MNGRRRIAVVTGTRAEFGLLRTVMRAIEAHDTLELSTIVTGAHLLPPDHTINDIAAEFTIDCSFEMQRAHNTGRAADVAAVARGMAAFAEHLPPLKPDVLLVLGDRIEAFAGASAASIAGIRVAHMHGGDRAQGIADEAMRHAITKLSHIHLPATAQSAERIERMGEESHRIHNVGSPAVDGLLNIAPMDDEQYKQFGEPTFIVLMHPTGREDNIEASDMQIVLESCLNCGAVLALNPNHDAGREGIISELERSAVTRCSHLRRDEFIGLLQRVQAIVGNSSAGLIEAAVLSVPAVNIGSRQNGRERPDSVIDVRELSRVTIDQALKLAMQRGHQQTNHPYGDGTTGRRVADLLANFDPARHPITKRNTY